MRIYKVSILLTVFCFIFSCSMYELSGPETSKKKESRVLKNGFLFGQPIVYEKINGLNVFQGDIILSDEQISEISNNSKGAGTNITSLYWPNGIIPYTIGVREPAKTELQKALTDIESKTNLIFVHRTTQNDYVRFLNCADPNIGTSALGRKGGDQRLLIGENLNAGAILHEMCHTVGIFHEHARGDRDSYVRIHWMNIIPGYETQFDKYSSGNDYGHFDWASVMLYNPLSFSDNGQPTITRLDNSIFPVNRTTLSSGDSACVNNMYPHIWDNKTNGQTATDIGVGANGDVFIIGAQNYYYGSFIYERVGNSWSRISGQATRIDVDSNGNPWVVNKQGSVFQYSYGWIHRGNMRAIDIGIGADGTIAIILNIDGNSYIYTWNGKNWIRFSDKPIPGEATRVSVDSYGNPWVVNSIGMIWKWGSYNYWVRVDAGKCFPALDIGVGADGTVMALGGNRISGWGNEIYIYEGNTDNQTNDWKKITGGAVAIDLANYGTPWILTETNNIYN